MNRKALLCCLVLFSVSVIQAQTIFAGGVVSAASLAPAGSPGAAVAPGSIVSIFGTNLGTSTAGALSVPLPTTLGGAKVTIGGKTASLYYVSATQINAQVPVDVATGAQPVTVTTTGAASPAVNVTITATAPAIFSSSQTGHGPGAIQNYISTNSQPANSFSGAAAPGSLVIVYGTGGGALQSGPASGAACSGQKLSAAASATVGAAAATLEFAGCSPNFVGLDQYNVRLPAAAQLPDGCFLPLQLTVGGVPSNMVTLSISKTGNCNSATTGSQGYSANGSVGVGVLVRTSISLGSFGGFDLGTTVASAFAGSFAKYSALGQTSAGSNAIPPAGGGCYVEVVKSSNGAAPSSADVTATYLDAGTLTLRTPSSGTYSMTRDKSTGNYGTAGTSLSGGLNITTGTYSLSGSGGADVGSFSTSLSIPTLFNVTNLGYAGGNASQSTAITPTWTCPDPSGQVFAIIGSGNTTTGLYGSGYCTAACSDGKLTIPSSVLKQLPVSSPNLFFLYLTYEPNVTNGGKINASGLTIPGYFLYTDASGNVGTLNP